MIAESEILANNDEVVWDEAWAFIEDFNDVEAIEKFLNKIEKYSNREIHFDLMRLRLSLLKKNDKEVSRITLDILETGGIKDIKQDNALKLVNYLTKISNHNEALSILDNLENVGQVRTLKIENLRKIGEYEKALEILSEVRDGNQITDGERFEGIRLAWDIGDMNLVKVSQMRF